MLNAKVIVRHTFNNILSRYNVDTLDTSSDSVSDEEKEIIQFVQFLTDTFYTKFKLNIRKNMDTVKMTYGKLSDCLRELSLHSFRYRIDWSHIIAYMIFVAEATVHYSKKNSAENTLDFAWSILWGSFEEKLNIWIQEQGGWSSLAMKKKLFGFF